MGAVLKRFPQVLLLSAYDASSHRYWREGLARHLVDCEFTQLTLPARYFSWRVRGNSLSWGWGERELLQRRYDWLIATSLVDLSSLRGFVPHLARVPTLVYFHENQFAYPASDAQHPSIEPQWVNLYSALCADRVAFNSDWNRRSFLDGVDSLLRRLPDQVPAGLVAILEGKSSVLPVPIDTLPVDAISSSAAPSSSTCEVVWNHRWEYDKGPEILLAAIRHCLQQDLPVRFHVIGQQFRRHPAAFDEIEALLGTAPEARGQLGYIESADDYRALLRRSQVVLSTALHEFQGIAVLEAALQGCRPLVPNRLSYPEYIPESNRYTSTPGQPDREGRAIAATLARWLSATKPAAWTAPQRLLDCRWSVQAPHYRALLDQCREAHRQAQHLPPAWG